MNTTRDVVVAMVTAVVVATCCPAVRNRAMRDNTQNPGKTTAAAEIISSAIRREPKGKYARSFLIVFFSVSEKINTRKRNEWCEKINK